MAYRKGKIPPRKSPNLPGGMNRTEANYAHLLEDQVRAGEVIAWRYEHMKFRVAKNAFYTPDFMVVYEDRIEFHEIKGFMREAALVRFKAAADQYPEFAWKMIRYERGGWNTFMEL